MPIWLLSKGKVYTEELYLVVTASLRHQFVKNLTGWKITKALPNIFQQLKN